MTDKMLNILLIEDDQVDIMNVKRAFDKNRITNPLYVATNGLEALEIHHVCAPDVPFFLVSGTIGEDLAVAAMEAGANDYLLKDNLARLGPADARELRDAQGRRERHHERDLTRGIILCRCRRDAGEYRQRYCDYKLFHERHPPVIALPQVLARRRGCEDPGLQTRGFAASQLNPWLISFHPSGVSGESLFKTWKKQLASGV